MDAGKSIAADLRNAAEPQPKRNIYHGGAETRRKPKSNGRRQNLNSENTEKLRKTRRVEEKTGMRRLAKRILRGMERI
jgi:hypothetical protein